MATTTTDTAPAAAAAPAAAPAMSMPAIAADLDTSGPADIPAATEFTPAGAPVQVTPIDVDHPAVDNNPRANTTVEMNKIDFNDPVKTGAEIAADGAEPEKSKA